MSILFVFGIPATMIVLLVWIKKKERMKRYELQADLYAKALEKGETLPDDLFDRSYTLKIEKERRENEKEELAELKQNALNVGIICMCVAFAVSACLWLAAFILSKTSLDLALELPVSIIKAVSTIGIIPFAIGIAFVIIHLIGNEKDAVEDAK